MGGKPHKDRSGKGKVKGNPLYSTPSGTVASPRLATPTASPSTPSIPKPESKGTSVPQRTVTLQHPYEYNDAPYRPNVLSALARAPVAEKPGAHSLLRLPPELLLDILVHLRRRALDSNEAYLWRRAQIDFMCTCSAINARARGLYQFRTLDYLAPLSGVYQCNTRANVTIYSRPFEGFAYTFAYELDIPANKITGELKVGVAEGAAAVTLKLEHFQLVPVFGRQLTRELRCFPFENTYRFGVVYSYSEEEKRREGLGMWRVTGVLLKLFISVRDWNEKLDAQTRDALLARETAIADKFRLCNQQTTICDDEARSVFTQIFTVGRKIVDNIYGFEKLGKPVRNRNNSSSSTSTYSYSDDDSCSYSLDECPLPNIEKDLKIKCRGMYVGAFSTHGVTSEHVLAAMSGASDGPKRDPERAAVCAAKMKSPMSTPHLTFYNYNQYMKRCGILPQGSIDAIDGIDSGDACCEREVQRLVDGICVSADAETKRALVSAVSKECMVAPGMNDEEISTRVLELWNEMLAV